MRQLFLVTFVMVFVFRWVSHGQAPETLERILLPIVTRGTPGAGGSIWIAELQVFNDGPTPASLLFPQRVSDSEGAPPGMTIFVPAWNDIHEPPGLFMYIEKEKTSDLHFHLRIRDLSRGQENFGTELPIIREHDFREKKVAFLRVPTDSRFRQTLRVYESASSGSAIVRVGVFADRGIADVGKIPIVSFALDLPARIPAFHPGYNDVFDLIQKFPQLQEHASVRVELEPMTPGMRFWAFISVTNNETQHVTLITPQ